MAMRALFIVAAGLSFLSLLLALKLVPEPEEKLDRATINSNITKVPPERFGWLFTKADTYRDPNLLPNIEALQRNVDMTQDLGFVKKKIDVKKYLDLSLAQDAAKRLK